MIEEIVRHAARQLGAAVANTVNLMAPDMVVLGGGLVEEMPKLFVEEVKNSILRIAMRSLSGDVKVAAARLGDNAVVMGAAALAADARESGK
jgi:glucokinase